MFGRIPQRAPFVKFLLHDVRIAFVIQIYPNKDKCTRKRHDGDESGGGGEFFSNCRGSQNYNHADNNLDHNLHHILPAQLLTYCFW